ncbi:hypothetical protein C8F01DRAFT_1093826 [Mycena amicta]|nr:hypothetical protein C8F01DRAFT_1093826 [Mycena amicta]
MSSASPFPPASTLLDPSAFPSSVAVRFYRIDGRKGRQNIRLSRPLIPTAFTMRRLVSVLEEGFWDRSGLDCMQCRPLRTSLHSPTHLWALTAISCCPHDRGDNDFDDETGNQAVASLFSNGYTPIAGNLLVFKHTDDPDLPHSLLDTRPLDVEAGDKDLINAFVCQLYGGNTEALPANEFVLGDAPEPRPETVPRIHAYNSNSGLQWAHWGYDLTCSYGLFDGETRDFTADRLRGQRLRNRNWQKMLLAKRPPIPKPKKKKAPLRVEEMSVVERIIHETHTELLCQTWARRQATFSARSSLDRLLRKAHQAYFDIDDEDQRELLNEHIATLQAKQEGQQTLYDDYDEDEEWLLNHTTASMFFW